MVNVSQRIKDLESKLKNISNSLNILKQTTQNLESKNRAEINNKEKELEDWRSKLEVLQKERNQIKKEIKAKVRELEISQLSNSEKQAQINRLLTEHSQELEAVDKLLYDERSQYRKIRDKLIGKLCEPCQVCQVNQQTIKQKDKKIVYLLGIIGLMVGLFFVFQLWLLGVAMPKYIKKRLREQKILKN